MPCILIALNIIYLDYQNFDLFLSEVESSFFLKQNMYVVTTAGTGILMAIIFLNHVYFENHESLCIL